MTHPRGFGSQARSPCFLRQSLDTRWDSPGTGRTCYTRLWRPRGGVGGQVGQGEGHMSSGDGNRSRARQASHQVIGGQRQGGGWGDYTSWRWRFLLVHPPPSAHHGPQGCTRTGHLWWLHGTAQRSRVTMTSCSRPVPDSQNAQRRQNAATKAKHSCRCILWGLSQWRQRDIPTMCSREE